MAPRRTAACSPASLPLVRPLLPLLALLMAARQAAAAQAPFQRININGSDYYVSYARTSYNDSTQQLMSQPWWNSKSVAGVTANQSAPLGVTGIVAGDKYGPLFTWEKTEQQGGTVCHWSWDFQNLRAVESCTYPLNMVLNHSVVSTPPLAVYTSASSAVIEVFEDAATPLQLSMVNTSCGAAPCTGRWELYRSMADPPFATVAGTVINITAGNTSSLISTASDTPPFNVTLRAVYVNKDLVAAYELITIIVVNVPPPTVGSASASPPTVEGPGAVALTASDITCQMGRCTTSWRVICPGQSGGFNFTKPGVNASVSTGFGGGFDIDLTTLANYSCSATVTVVDTATGRTGSNVAAFQVVNVPPPTVGSASASPPTVEGPGAVALTASDITCPMGPCTTSWRVICPGQSGGFNFTKPGVNASVSTGFGGGFDIDLTTLANYSCSATVTVVDTATGRIGTTGEATFEVVNVPPPTVGAVAASPTDIQGPGIVHLTASDVTCPSMSGPCTSTWRITCQAQGADNSTVPAAGSPDFTKQGSNSSVSIGYGGSYDFDLNLPANYSCSANVTVNDTATGRTASTGEATFEVIIFQPTAVITPAGPTINVTAGGSASLNASGSSCPGTPGNCTFTWSLNCTGQDIVQAAGVAFTITTGPGAGRTVNTARSASVSCIATLTAIDGNGLTATKTLALLVLPAPPICNATTVSRTTLVGFPLGQACEPVKALRNPKTTQKQMTRAMRNVVTVLFALADPQGFNANMTFDSVNSNRAEANCGPNRSGVCVPEARNLGGGNLQILPQLFSPARRGDTGGRVLRVAYTATIRETGLSCSGTVDVCTPPNKRATTCAAFSSTGVVRPVHRC